MARSIILRFETTCFDCGRSLSAGTTARWFGRGRVSCGCTTKLAAEVYRAAVDRVDNAPLQPDSIPAHKPWIDDAPPHPDAEIVRALVTGLNPAQVARIAQASPKTHLLVRLQSGARFIVPAEHALHLLSCVSESCRDKVRDVTRAAT